MIETINDIACVAASIVLLAGYHLYLRIKVHRNPYYSIQAVNRAARSAWVKGIMQDESRSVLGVQTLRNSTMAATFLASTAVLLIIGTLTLSEQTDKLVNTWQSLNALGSLHPGLWTAKLLFLLSNFFMAFFSFAMSVRLYNHVGYQINVPAKDRPPAINPKNVAIHLNRAGYYYSLGMRAYYYSVPLVFWLFGPLFMLAATLVLIAVLYHVDRAPQYTEELARTALDELNGGSGSNPVL
ncbi:MAG: DUF599 domain-containing protein [Thiogranum sp.]|nr:DUF599 domain-containing protein [Thiogranum sp.]